MTKLYIIGYGPGDESLTTLRTQQLIGSAKRVLSTERIAATDPRVSGMSLSDLVDELKKPVDGDTVVLVSGDSGFYSATKRIIEYYSELYQIEVIPGISSIAQMSARVQASYDDAMLLSMHGRNENIVPLVAYNKKIFALTGGENRAEHICFHLDRYGLGDVKVVVGERLSYADETITKGTASELKDQLFDNLAVIYIENPAAVDPRIPLNDEDFIRTDVPMTKAEVRWLSIQKLEVCPTDIIYDIGAGTGSVAIELARRADRGIVYAIEKEAEACELIRKNALSLGAYNLEVVEQEATAAMRWLPRPDRAFIGGSGGNLDAIVKRLVSVNRNIRLVINAVTLQTLQESFKVLDRHGFKDYEVLCLNIAKAKRVKKYDLMMASNPVYVISGTAG